MQSIEHPGSRIDFKTHEGLQALDVLLWRGGAEGSGDMKERNVQQNQYPRYEPK